MKIIIVLSIVFIVSAAFADTIYLKSGKSVEGTITSQSDEKIVVEVVPGIPITYYRDEIESVDGKAAQPEPKKTIDIYNKDYLFKIKSGIVTYKLEGSRIGTRTLYFDDYGTKLMWIEESQLYRGGKLYPVKRQMVLQKDNIGYMIDLERMTAVKETRGDWGKDDMVQAIIKGMSEGSDSDASDQVADEITSQVAEEFASKVFKEPDVLGTEVILGRTCEIIEAGFAKSCLYKGIPLKEERTYTGRKMVAIAFEENIEIPEETFELPDDIEITGEYDHSKMMESMFQPPDKKR